MTDTLDNSAPFNDDQGTRIARDGDKSTGAGAEAAEGIHGAPQQRESRRDPSDKTSLEDRSADDARDGSEPIASESHEHESGYGGRAGQPKRPNGGPAGQR
jgi:hypothetical protein